MQDVNSELLKLKALINNKQNTSVFANKANDCTQLVHDGYKLYVNDMTKKFTFTTANTQNPITIDTRTHAIDNVEYIDDLKISDLKGLKQQLDDEIEARIAGDEALDEAKADVDHTHEISDVSGLQTALDNKASTNHTHTDINYEITFRDLLTFKDDGKLRWHITDAEFLNGHVSGTLVQKFQIGTEKLVVYDTVSVWNRLTADNITLGLNNGQDLGTLISTKADNSMLTALAARVAIVETGKADVNHTHNDYVKTSFNNFDEDPSDNIYFESWFPQGYDTFLKLEERTKDNSYSDTTTLKPQYLEFSHNDYSNNTQKFATYGVDGIEFTNGETIQQGTIDAKISMAINNHTHTSFNNALEVNTNAAAALTITHSQQSTTYINPVQIFNSNLASGHQVNILIGKASSAYQSGYIGFQYHATDPSMSIGLHSANRILNIYKDKVEATKTFTAPNVKADNEQRLADLETRLAAVETRLASIAIRLAALEN